MAKRKLQTELSLQQKSEVLLRIQKGESQRKLAEQNGMSKMKIANIKKNEHYIVNSVDSNCSQNRKRKMRRTENESDVVSPLSEALQFEVASKDDILENGANIPVNEIIAFTTECNLGNIMTGRTEGEPLDDEEEVEEEAVDQQPPNRSPSHSEGLQICLTYSPH